MVQLKRTISLRRTSSTEAPHLANQCAYSLPWQRFWWQETTQSWQRSWEICLINRVYAGGVDYPTWLSNIEGEVKAIKNCV